MKKIKNLMKKGGVAEVVTIVIFVGLAIGLIVGYILPLVTDAGKTGAENKTNYGTVSDTIGNLAKPTQEGASGI